MLILELSQNEKASVEVNDLLGKRRKTWVD